MKEILIFERKKFALKFVKVFVEYTVYIFYYLSTNFDIFYCCLAFVLLKLETVGIFKISLFVFELFKKMFLKSFLT